MASRSERLSATSRDREEWATKTEAAREARALVAEQVAAQIIEADIMGGRGRVALALRAVAAAEQQQDSGALRAAWMDVASAAGATVAALDLKA